MIEDRSHPYDIARKRVEQAMGPYPSFRFIYLHFVVIVVLTGWLPWTVLKFAGVYVSDRMENALLVGGVIACLVYFLFQKAQQKAWDRMLKDEMDKVNQEDAAKPESL